MAGPVNSFMRVPDDASYTGKRARTQTKSVGGVDVHEQVMVPGRQAVVLGIYGSTSALQSVQASAQNGTSTGFLWMHVPTSVSGKAARVREFAVRHSPGSGVVTMPTTPRLALGRFTFTGTASGASLSHQRYAASYPAPVLDLRTVVTGLTVTLINAGIGIAGSLVPPLLVSGTLADMLWAPSVVDYMLESDAGEDQWPVLLPGEGLVLWQPDAGTASDARRFIYDIKWDEIDVA